MTCGPLGPCPRPPVLCAEILTNYYSGSSPWAVTYARSGFWSGWYFQGGLPVPYAQDWNRYVLYLRVQWWNGSTASSPWYETPIASVVQRSPWDFNGAVYQDNICLL